MLLLVWYELTPRINSSEKSLFMWVLGTTIGVIAFEVGLRKFAQMLAMDNDMKRLAMLANYTIPLWAAVFFALSVYPNIASSWGGGKPVFVTITFSKDSPLAGSKLSRVLIDETDTAFYIADGEHQQAHYIPKSSVALLDYGGKK